MSINSSLINHFKCALNRENQQICSKWKSESKIIKWNFNAVNTHWMLTIDLISMSSVKRILTMQLFIIIIFYFCLWFFWNTYDKFTIGARKEFSLEFERFNRITKWFHFIRMKKENNTKQSKIKSKKQKRKEKKTDFLWIEFIWDQS